MHLAGSTAAPDESIDPSARKKRGRQDDKTKGSLGELGVSAVKDVDVFRALAKAGQRLAEIHVQVKSLPALIT